MRRRDSSRNNKRYEEREWWSGSICWLSDSWPSFFPVVCGTQTGCAGVDKSQTYCLDGHSALLRSVDCLS